MCVHVCTCKNLLVLVYTETFLCILCTGKFFIKLLKN